MEYQLFNKKDIFVTLGSENDAQKYKLFTRSVHIILKNKTGLLLIAKRAKSKRVYPNLYTSTAGGHVEVGESYLQAAKRELEEETGLKNLPLLDYGYFRVINTEERAHHHLFVATIDTSTHVGIDESEVQNYKWTKPAVILSRIENNKDMFAPPFIKAFAQYNKPPIIMFDFDHTLFNWYAFKKDLIKKLAREHGISQHVFEDTKDIHEHRDGLYNIHTHMRKISLVTRVSFTALDNAVLTLLQSETYIYEDAAKLLHKLEHTSAKLCLLSFGDKANQLFFIKGTNIHNLFKKITIVTSKEAKVSVLEKIDSKKQCVISINDDPDEGTIFNQYLSTPAHNILIERKDGKYTTIASSPAYTKITSLEQINIFYIKAKN